MAPKVKAAAKAMVKAKAKAKAKPKAKAKALPARGGRVRGVPLRRGRGLRRPAADRSGGPALTVEDRWKGGEEVLLRELGLETFVKGLKVVVTEGYYFSQRMQMAGVIKDMEMSADRFVLIMEPTGTDSDALLKFVTGQTGTKVRLIRCGPDCTHLEVADDMIHIVKGRLQKEGDHEVGWVENLLKVVPMEGADDLEALRKRSAELGLGGGVPPPAGRPAGAPEEIAEAEKGKKKKKRKKEKRGTGKEGGDTTERKDKVALDGTGPRAAAQKSLGDLFSGTGVDPREKVRARVARRARRYLRKKGKESTSTSSSEEKSTESGSTSVELLGGEEESIFSQASKIKQLSERFPGTLACQSLAQMRATILSEVGEESRSSSLRPVAVQHFKQTLAKRAQGPAQRELMTVASTVDALLKGKPSVALDILCQRYKSIEASMSGSHWTVAQRLEVLPSESVILTAPQELTAAQREVSAETKARFMASLPDGRKGPKGSGKSKEEGKKGQDKRPWKGGGSKGDGGKRKQETADDRK